MAWHGTLRAVPRNAPAVDVEQLKPRREGRAACSNLVHPDGGSEVARPIIDSRSPMRNLSPRYAPSPSTPDSHKGIQDAKTCWPRARGRTPDAIVAARRSGSGACSASAPTHCRQVVCENQSPHGAQRPLPHPANQARANRFPLIGHPCLSFEHSGVVAILALDQ